MIDYRERILSTQNALKVNGKAFRQLPTDIYSKCISNKQVFCLFVNIKKLVNIIVLGDQPYSTNAYNGVYVEQHWSIPLETLSWDAEGKGLACH